MESLLAYIVISLLNVFIHVAKTILVVRSSKIIASLSNCLCYTFSAVVIKFIAESDLITALCVQACTNFFGCYLAMWVTEKFLNKNNYEQH